MCTDFIATMYVTWLAQHHGSILYCGDELLNRCRYASFFPNIDIIFSSRYYNQNSSLPCPVPHLPDMTEEEKLLRQKSSSYNFSSLLSSTTVVHYTHIILNPECHVLLCTDSFVISKNFLLEGVMY